jgi:CIC family chloride channel protein
VRCVVCNRSCRRRLSAAFILPALLCSAVATATARSLLPNVPTYEIPHYPQSSPAPVFAIVCGLAAGPFSVTYERFVRCAEHNKPVGWKRVAQPILGMALLGMAASRLPQLLGNGHDVSQLSFRWRVPFHLAALLLLLKPAATLSCV